MFRKVSNVGIAGNIDDILIKLCGDLVNFSKVTKFKLNLTRVSVNTTLSIQIIKFKFYQHQMRAVSPNSPKLPAKAILGGLHMAYLRLRDTVS